MYISEFVYNIDRNEEIIEVSQPLILEKNVDGEKRYQYCVSTSDEKETVNFADIERKFDSPLANDSMNRFSMKPNVNAKQELNVSKGWRGVETQEILSLHPEYCSLKVTPEWINDGVNEIFV